MNTVNLRRIFQSKFDYQTYCNDIVHSIFGCNDINKRPEQIKVTTEGDKCYFIGRMTDAEGRELGFFYTQMAPGGDVRRKRVGLRKLIAPYVRYEVDAAIAVFDDGTRWRLSYICDMNEGATSPKRFSYVLGDAEGQYNTPTHRLGDLSGKLRTLRISDIFDAFSVETLSKEFFEKYHIHYDCIVSELARQGKTGAVYHDYVKKLMGRIVFLHFLQKKGWLCGDTNFMLNTFSQSTRRSDYLESVLEPLFFGILNTEPAKREQVFSRNGWQQNLVEKWASIPYLNGGLFERDEVDNLRIVLPEYIFSNLFAFLASYNFTVDENDPDDAEIGVDPEMLGKIFESLLEDNKAKGAFYTPKEIVRYMCKESLIAHLASKLPNVADSVVRAFVEHHEMQPELESYRNILESVLREVKICDPAIGSGAFPMGLLNELWRCREALGTQMSRLQLKKEIIENNIYGVDIERGAIDIARLRFWLSIVVDSETAEPLPNFDYKFMQGNSLIESYGGFDLSRIAGKTVGRPSTSTQYVIGLDSDLSQKNLQRLLREYFSVTDHQKKATMRHAINAEVKTLIRESVGGTPTFLAKLEQLDPSANQDFFLWHTWFKDIFDKGGFDVVIGNPPYFQVKKGMVDKNKYPYSEGKDKGKQNVYKLFVEHSYNILSTNGICTLITQSSLMCDSSSQFTRELLLKKTTISQIIEFPKVAPHPGGQLFKGALVATCIVLYRKTIPTKEHVFCLSAHNDLTTLENFDFAQLSQQTPIEFYPEGFCFPLIRRQDFPIIEKMNDGTMFLGKMIQSSSQGDFNLTNESFCFSTKPTNVKMYRGCHVHRYYIDNEVEEFILGGYKNDIVQNNIKNRYIVCQQISGMTDKRRFNVAITKQDKCLFGNSVNKLAICREYNPFYILAIINSQVIDWYFRKTSTNNHVNIYELEQLPIPKASIEQQNPIVDLINKIMEKKQYNSAADISLLEREIDRLVYKLYNLTDEEIALIEL